MSSAKVSAPVIVASALMCGLGIGIFIASIVVLSVGEGIAGGTWYTGVSAFITGLRGMYLPNSRAYQYVWIASLITFVFSLAGSVINGVNYVYYSELEACSSYVPSGTGNCPLIGSLTTSYYDCYGDSSYYSAAEYCELASTGTTCSCVNSDAPTTTITGEGYTCFLFDGPNDCNVLLTSLPRAIHAAWALCMITLFASLFLSCLTATAAYRPQYIDSTIPSTTATIVQHSSPPVTSAYVLNPGATIIIQPATANPVSAEPAAHATQTAEVVSPKV